MVRSSRTLRQMTALAAISLLSACAGQHIANIPATQEAAEYKAKAKPDYRPPGPPDDPWGPYITEAATRFDVPQPWIRGVMRVESGGYQYRPSGVLTTSPVGAMGLMQLMPVTYDELRGRYSLGDDAYDPHNNILAGAAYLRELYDAFGSPAFLAAYDAGPGRLEDYLTHNRPLPDETRRYVAMIGPGIRGAWPQNRSAAEQYAVNQIPIDIPAGPRYVRRTRVALASRDRRHHEAGTEFAVIDRHATRRVAEPPPVEVAEAPMPQATRPQARFAAASPAHAHGGLHLIASAVASEAVPSGGGHAWAIQVGAYANAGQAASAASAARGHAPALGGARPMVATVRDSRGTLYRARLGGLTRASAVQACQTLSHGHGGCIVVSPASQS